MGRVCKLKRIDIIKIIGEETIGRIYTNADILHCEPIEKTANVYIEMFNIKKGNFDNVEACEYEVPDYWAIGDVYARFVEDINGNDIVKTIILAYSSFISDSISNYNSDFYYQSREYIYECYKENKII